MLGESEKGWGRYWKEKAGAGIRNRGVERVLESGSGPNIGKRGSVLVGVMTKRIKHCIHCSQMCALLLFQISIYIWCTRVTKFGRFLHVHLANSHWCMPHCEVSYHL